MVVRLATALEMERRTKPVNTIKKLLSGAPVIITALGDSLTYGWMVAKGYLDFLAEMIGERFPDARVSLINCGMPAGTARDGLSRLEGDVLHRSPDCIFVQFGLNDAFSGCSPEEFRDHVEMIIKRIRENTHSEIVIMTSVCLGNRRDDTMVEKYYAQLEELADLYGLPLVRVHMYWKEKISRGCPFNTLVQSDQVHPVSDGYRLMAEAIMELFQ